MHTTHRSILFSLLLLVSALILSACPKQQSASTSAEQEPIAEPSRFQGTTASFVSGLCSLKVYGYTIDDSGAAVVYEEVTFTEEGSFTANTSIRLGEEPLECVESSLWSIDDDRADNSKSAAITLEVTSTNCPGRSAPASFHLRAQLEDDEIQLSHI